MKKAISVTAMVAWMLTLLGTSSVQGNFYEGKTIRIVGFPPGGGYDAWRGCFRGTCRNIFPAIRRLSSTSHCR